VFEAELRRAGLRYVLLGSQSFFDRREVRDLLAYLKVIASPGDENSLLRIINTPARGIGDKTVERILNRAVRDGRSFRDSVANCRGEGLISDKAANAVDGFFELLDSFGGRMQQQPHRLEDHVGELIEAIGYEVELERQYKDPQQRLARAAVMEDFLESIREYRARTHEPSLHGFLTDCALDGRQEEPDKEAEAEQDAVKLMTLHSAKGLEFPWVYLVGLEEGLLPHRRSVDATAREIEEERRLTYVGVTRAQDRLAVTRAANRRKWGKLRPSPPSRFLFEMRGEGNIAVEDQPLDPSQTETA
jgi:DNA helicase-2/ATP-dependent DNA helicase PcrA